MATIHLFSPVKLSTKGRLHNRFCFRGMQCHSDMRSSLGKICPVLNGDKIRGLQMVSILSQQVVAQKRES